MISIDDFTDLFSGCMKLSSLTKYKRKCSKNIIEAIKTDVKTSKKEKIVGISNKE